MSHVQEMLENDNTSFFQPVFKCQRHNKEMLFIYISNSAMKRELALTLNFCLLGLIARLPNTYSKITVHGVSLSLSFSLPPFFIFTWKDDMPPPVFAVTCFCVLLLDNASMWRGFLIILALRKSGRERRTGYGTWWFQRGLSALHLDAPLNLVGPLSPHDGWSHIKVRTEVVCPY